MHKYILRGLAVFITIFIAIGGVALLKRTYVNPMMPVAMSVAAGATIALMLRNRCEAVTGIRRRGIGLAVMFVAAAALSFGALLIGNFAGAHRDRTEPVAATVVAKHVRTEHPTRRVGRGRYVRDTSRKIYHYSYTLRLADGHTVEQPTTASKYAHLRIGTKTTMELCRGALGWTVVL